MRLLADRPYLLSLAIIAIVTLWMFIPAEESNITSQSQPVVGLQQVQVTRMTWQLLTLRETFTAQTKAHKTATVSAELDAVVKQTHVKRGDWVNQDDKLVTLSTGSLTAALRGAEAERSRAQLEYNTKKKLSDQGFLVQQEIASAYAALQAARADFDFYANEIAKAELLAPFSGVVVDIHSEIGDFASIGQPLLQLISIDPLIIAGEVSERDVRSLSVGIAADVRVLGGESVTGTISYISPVATQATRAFPVEITVPNPSMDLAVGMTASVDVAIEKILAFKISPSILTLNSQGDVQVATVDEENVVQIRTVTIQYAETDGIWITGIPNGSRVITLGQGFVRNGETVNAVESEASGFSGSGLLENAGSSNSEATSIRINTL